jgi:hypothetical protein
MFPSTSGLTTPVASGATPWDCEKIESERSRPITALNLQPKTHAERAFHLGGAGAWDRCPPAHAECRK